jgi:hypothetical protein
VTLNLRGRATKGGRGCGRLACWTASGLRADLARSNQGVLGRSASESPAPFASASMREIQRLGFERLPFSFLALVR